MVRARCTDLDEVIQMSHNELEEGLRKAGFDLGKLEERTIHVILGRSHYDYLVHQLETLARLGEREEVRELLEEIEQALKEGRA